jgi:hypothetical protein
VLPLASKKVNRMEQAYWLRRTRAASQMARRANSAEARMAHLELAGRYSIMAATASRRPPAVPSQLHLRAPAGETAIDATFGGAAYYERLEAGARWMALQARSSSERNRHITAANRYARLRSDAAASNGVHA